MAEATVGVLQYRLRDLSLDAKENGLTIGLQYRLRDLSPVVMAEATTVGVLQYRLRDLTPEPLSYLMDTDFQYRLCNLLSRHIKTRFATNQ